MTGSSSKISFNSLPTDDPKQRKPDITLAHERYEWEPQVHLREGLVQTIAYFENLLANGELRER
jgi:UDP-glucuronate decarboxylase